jgi:hypothetical protein
MSSWRSLGQRMMSSHPHVYFFLNQFCDVSILVFLILIFFGQISHHLDQKITPLRRRGVQRLFIGKKCANVAIFWGWTGENLPFLDNDFLEVARTKRDSKRFYFLVCALAKFGSLIASSPTWQNWKKNLDSHMAI